MIHSQPVFTEREQDPSSNPLAAYNERKQTLPTLHRVAKRVFAVPASSAEVERTFSTAGDVLRPERASLKPSTVNRLVFLARNLREELREKHSVGDDHHRPVEHKRSKT